LKLPKGEVRSPRDHWPNKLDKQTNSVRQNSTQTTTDWATRTHRVFWECQHFLSHLWYQSCYCNIFGYKSWKRKTNRWIQLDINKCMLNAINLRWPPLYLKIKPNSVRIRF
jgi:hypothetical protein